MSFQQYLSWKVVMEVFVPVDVEEDWSGKCTSGSYENVLIKEIFGAFSFSYSLGPRRAFPLCPEGRFTTAGIRKWFLIDREYAAGTSLDLQIGSILPSGQSSFSYNKWSVFGLLLDRWLGLEGPWAVAHQRSGFKSPPKTDHLKSRAGKNPLVFEKLSLSWEKVTFQRTGLFPEALDSHDLWHWPLTSISSWVGDPVNGVTVMLKEIPAKWLLARQCVLFLFSGEHNHAGITFWLKRLTPRILL